jgi:hypothetical protein
MARRGDVAHAQGHANTDFVAESRGGVGRDAVDANVARISPMPAKFPFRSNPKRGCVYCGLPVDLLRFRRCVGDCFGSSMRYRSYL